MSNRPPGYDAGAYPPFAVTADVALFTIRASALEVLLIRRGGDPYRGTWALPGGFVRVDEDLDTAAARELAEETGLAGGPWHLEQLAAYGAPDRDPRMRVVTIAYWAVCARLPAPPRGGSDAAAAALLPVAAVESGELRLAFDHERIVRDAVERIRARMEHTALAAGFCPPVFTIPQLRQVYETVWGVRLDPGNFHRSVRESEAFLPWADPPPALREASSRNVARAPVSHTPSAKRSPPKVHEMRDARAFLSPLPERDSLPPSPPDEPPAVHEMRDAPAFLNPLAKRGPPPSPPDEPLSVSGKRAVRESDISPMGPKLHAMYAAQRAVPTRRGRPAALWTARRTDGPLPVMARTIARPQPRPPGGDPDPTEGR